MAFKDIKGIIQKNYEIEGQDLHLQPANQMKIYIPNPEKFFPETLEFYMSFAEFAGPDEADLVVINDFEPIESTKPVACNSTGLDHINAPEIISLRGEDLSDFTAVPELTLGIMIYLTRVFKREEIKGKTLGIIGSEGRIGKILTNMAEALGVNVIHYDIKNSVVEQDMVTKNCIECSKGFKSKPSASRKFCSQKCYFKTLGQKQLGKNNPFYKTGLGASNFYNVWRSILKRCHNKKHKSYTRYGGRGVKVLWNSFEDFTKDMYKDYLKHQNEFGVRNTTIERINNEGDYCKENCKWATWKEQAKNRKLRKRNNSGQFI